MKKLLMIIVTVLLIVLLSITVVNGVNIGEFSILGLKTIQEENDELDKAVQEATKMASTDYKNKMSELNNAIDDLEAKKEEYQDMTEVSTDSENTLTNQTSKYKIEYLWVRIGNHAKSEGVEMKIEVSRSSSGSQELYNLNFTATGTYVGIADFISDIEDDTNLGFKIEEFKMISTGNDGSTVQATFACKDIEIDGISNSTVSTTNTNTTENVTEDTNNTNDTNNINNTNNTVDNNSTNTTANTTE